MQNFYEILEVSEKASPEVIEKAYKVLVKRYHPDLQQDAIKKQEAENKMKQVNEAYSILSDTNKRQDYDNKLKLYNEQKRAAGTDYVRNVVRNSGTTSNNVNSEAEVNRKVQEAYKEAYKRAYNQYAQAYNENLKAQRQQASYRAYNGRNYAYRRPTFKEVLTEKLNNFIIIGLVVMIVMAVIMIVFAVPSIRNQITEAYDSNFFVRLLIKLLENFVDVLDNLFTF